MEKSDEGLKRLSRTEHIREEAKRALEFGQTPKRPLSLQPNFRVEKLAAAPRARCAAENAPGEQFLKLSSVQVVTSRNSNPLLPKESSRYLTEQIEYELKRKNNPEQAGKLLELLGGLNGPELNNQATQALRRRVLNQVFGERYFESEHDLPKERGPRGRGNSIFTRKGKD